jgi:hypothetical protein
MQEKYLFFKMTAAVFRFSAGFAQSQQNQIDERNINSRVESYSKQLRHTYTPRVRVTNALHLGEKSVPSVRQIKVSEGLIRLHAIKSMYCTQLPALLRFVT